MTYNRKILEHLPVFAGLLAITCCSSGSTPSQRIDAATLTGKWVVTAQTVPRLTIAPACKLVQRGTTFVFTADSLSIYLNDRSSPCDVYAYRSARGSISFIKEDMIWLCSYELKANNLQLKSNRFFTSEIPGEQAKSVDSATSMQTLVLNLERSKTELNTKH